MNFYIVGTSGCGKTTLAQHIAKTLNRHHIELDSFHFDTNWAERPDDAFTSDISKEVQKGPWVICGNYSNIQNLLMDQVDHVIWLDYPFPLILWRVLKRTVRRVLTQEKCCGNNYETWQQQLFTTHSIFKWVFMSHPKNRQRYQTLSQSPQHSHRIRRMRSPRQLQIYLNSLFA